MPASARAEGFRAREGAKATAVHIAHEAAISKKAVGQSLGDDRCDGGAARIQMDAIVLLLETKEAA